jgi:hypothetical protein
VNLGYCGLDRDRSPLRGDEIRPCWEAVPGAPGTEPASLGDLVVLPVEPPTTLRYGFFADSER